MDAGARPLVLLCDDEAGPRVAMACMLAASCEIVAASTAEDALMECQSRRFDVAIVDWMLPTTARDGVPRPAPDGWLVKALLEVDRDLAVVVWSAHGPRIEEAALAEGAVAMISKPISPEDAERSVCAAATVTRRNRASSAGRR